MKTVFIINQFANTPDLPGHTRQYEVAKGLEKSGWVVDVFSSDFNLSERRFKKLRNLELIKYEFIQNINWYWIRVLPYKKNNFFRYLNIISFCINLFFILTIKVFMKKLNKNNKLIILASSPQLPATFICLIISKIFSIPFVAEIRDLWPQVLIDLGGKNPKSFLIKTLSLIESFIYSKSKHLVVLSEGAINYVKKKGAKKVSFLPNGSDLEIFKYCKLKKENIKFSKERPFKVLYCGTHGEANDLIRIVEAAELLHSEPVKFILVGDGPTKNMLLKKSAHLKNIIFLSPKPKKEIPNLIANSDAMLLTLKDIPLFKYGVSPNKLYDSYAIGRPVINNVGGIIAKEINSYKIGINAIPEDSKSLSESILYLMNLTRNDREKMSIQARLLAEKKYSRKIINNKYNRILNLYLK